MRGNYRPRSALILNNTQRQTLYQSLLMLWQPGLKVRILWWKTLFYTAQVASDQNWHVGRQFHYQLSNGLIPKLFNEMNHFVVAEIIVPNYAIFWWIFNFWVLLHCVPISSVFFFSRACSSLKNKNKKSKKFRWVITNGLTFVSRA